MIRHTDTYRTRQRPVIPSNETARRIATQLITKTAVHEPQRSATKPSEDRNASQTLGMASELTGSARQPGRASIATLTVMTSNSCSTAT